MTERDEADALLPAIAEARERFMSLVAEVRPELFRYCARMTGSIFDGEDVVQDTLAKAHYALGQMTEAPPLRPWLFRIAHNTAMDFLKRYERKHVDVVAEVPDQADSSDGPDPELVEAALAAFASLPPIQRSALVLKDVLGHSLEETAATMGTTVAAVKSALVRARINVKDVSGAPVAATNEVSRDETAKLRRYAELFNARDWDALRALMGDEARLDLVSRAHRRGAGAQQYYSRYAEIADREDVRMEPGFVDGVAVLAVFRPSANPTPAYFIRIEWAGENIALIRDFRYVDYIAQGARFTSV